MPTEKKFDAILVAGEGESSYKVFHQHKAFLKINGKCIINYVVDALQKVNSIRAIYIVGLRDKLNDLFKKNAGDFDYQKPIHIVEQKTTFMKISGIPFCKRFLTGEASRFRKIPLIEIRLY